MSYVSSKVTDSMKAFLLFADGKEHTCREIADATGAGCDMTGVRLSYYRRKNWLVESNPGHRPLRFSITPVGRAALEAEPTEKPQKDKALPPGPNKRLVERAMAAQPTLMRVWGWAS